MFVWFVSLTVGYQLSRLYSICLEEYCELDIRKDITKSNCDLFEGTQHMILQNERAGKGAIEIERELTTLSVVMIVKHGE